MERCAALLGSSVCLTDLPDSVWARSDQVGASLGPGQWSAEHKERQGGTSEIISPMWVLSPLCCFADEGNEVERDEKDLFKVVDAPRCRVALQPDQSSSLPYSVSQPLPLY